MITLQVNIENEAFATMFAELIANFNFVRSVEIPELSKSYQAIPTMEDNALILPPKTLGNPSKFCGIWANKKITDVKQFRKKLWQRNH
jgi:hypothetical protein